MLDQVEIDLRSVRDLLSEIIERHQEIRREDVRLMLYLPVLGIPPDNILLPASHSLGIDKSVEEVVAEFVGERRNLRGVAI